MSHFPSFEVIPAVDVQDGEVVQLVGGERGTGKRYGDPVEAAAERWIEAGAETLHLVDLDGAFEGERVNADAIEAVVENVPDGSASSSAAAAGPPRARESSSIWGWTASSSGPRRSRRPRSSPRSTRRTRQQRRRQPRRERRRGRRERVDRGPASTRRRRPHATRSWARARSSLRTSTWRGSWKGSTARRWRASSTQWRSP